jgi:hypothetical protein
MSNNTAIVDFADGRHILLSYGVAVAAFIPYGITEGIDLTWLAEHGQCRGYIKSARKWSTTTSRHVNAFCGPNATTVPDEVFVQLVAPLAVKGR